MSQFKKIPYIPNSKELADQLFSNLKKIKVSKSKDGQTEKITFYRTLYFRQLRFLFKELESKLTTIVKTFPILSSLHPFHNELIDILYGVEKLKIALSRLMNTHRILESIQRDLYRKLGQCEDIFIAKKVRQEGIGRIGSIIDKLEEPLNILIEAKIHLAKIPEFDLDKKIIVVAGGPNAGKSSFVKLLSTGKPEIASYPFTTKTLICGHRKYFFENIQLIDTPGLLDRPLMERNAIEMKSILALKHLADLIIFLFDPTSDSPLPIEKQAHLFNEIKEKFSTIPIIPFINKGDRNLMEEIKQIKKFIGEVQVIATIEDEKEILEKIIDDIIKTIPEKKHIIIDDQSRKESTDQEIKKKEKKSKIEWIFFDRDDKN